MSAAKRRRCSSASVSFAEGVGEFDAAGVKLEPFRHPGVVRRHPR